MYINNSLFDINDIVARIKENILIEDYELIELKSSIGLSLISLNCKVKIFNNKCLIMLMLSTLSPDKRNLYKTLININNYELKLIKKIYDKLNNIDMDVNNLKILLSDYETLFIIENNKKELLNNDENIKSKQKVKN